MKPSSTPVPSQSRTTASTIAGAVLIALTLTRWLVPTEATADGETLWIAGLWFLAGAFLCLWPSGGATTRRWDLADLGAVLLIGGQIVSGVVVLATDGDRRAAVNLLWEWLSLGVFWFAWRAAISSPSLRQVIVPVLLVTAITLSIWGLYQYFVWYPQMKAEYLPLIDQFQQLHAANANTNEAARKLANVGIPTQEPGLTLFLNRLRDSREPFGPFALANTFGGVLAAWLMIGVGVMCESGRRKAEGGSPLPERRKSNAYFPSAFRLPASALLGMLLIAVCLYLTNSRTAWGGVLAGLCVGGVLAVAPKIHRSGLRSSLFPVATLAGVLLGVGVLRLISQEVQAVPGPLKSLAYRAEYWRGTMSLLLTSPWQGAGLGQFRDKYLMFKVPESSEEIADPHNLFLDVWANGGPVSLVGLSLLLAVVWHRIWRISRIGASECESAAVENGNPGLPPSHPHIPSPPHQLSASLRSWIVPGLLAFALAIAGQLYSTRVWDSQVDFLAIFAVVWGIVAVLWPKRLAASAEHHSWLGLLAVVVLSVHLLGAGGIAMPAVSQLWLLLIAWGTTPASESLALPAESKFRPLPWLSATSCLVLLVAWYVTAERPVHLARHAIEQGDRLLSSRGDADGARKRYQSAASSDPWSPEPWMRLASLAFSRFLADRNHAHREELAQAIEFADAGIALAPFRPALLIQKGDWLRDVARRSGEEHDWIAATKAYEAAAARHPTNALLLANLSICLNRSGKNAEAVELARRAVTQDELNRQRGHTDRYLSEDVLQQLRAILAVPSPQ